MWQSLVGLIDRLTDWFLIGIGLVLIAKAVLAVDVLLAKLLIAGIGMLFSGAGLWYRHRRKKRLR